MNEQIKQALLKFARDVAVAFVGLVLALAAVFGIASQGGSGGGQVGELGLAMQRFTNPVRFEQAATFNGAVTMNGALAATAVSVKGTPVFWATPASTATPQPTATPPGNFNGTQVIAGTVVANSGIFTTSVSIAGTPVVPYATPNVLKAPTTPQAIICGSDTITATAVIVHNLATPSFVTYGLAQDVTGDGARLSHTNSSAVVTIKVWNALQTPAAATTPAVVDWCVVGTK